MSEQTIGTSETVLIKEVFDLYTKAYYWDLSHLRNIHVCTQ